jgi:hypothetical protein
MKREQEIINQMLELANEYNNISCNYKKCEECKNKKFCDLITKFVSQVN